MAAQPLTHNLRFFFRIPGRCLLRFIQILNLLLYVAAGRKRLRTSYLVYVTVLSAASLGRRQCVQDILYMPNRI